MNQHQQRAIQAYADEHGLRPNKMTAEQIYGMFDAVLAVKPEPKFEWRQWANLSECFVNGKKIAWAEAITPTRYKTGLFADQSSNIRYETEEAARLAVESAFREWLNGIY